MINVDTALKVSKCVVFSGPYFSVFGLNTEIYSVYLRIQSEYRKMRTRKNSVIWKLFTQCWNHIPKVLQVFVKFQFGFHRPLCSELVIQQLQNQKHQFTNFRQNSCSDKFHKAQKNTPVSETAAF